MDPHKQLIWFALVVKARVQCLSNQFNNSVKISPMRGIANHRLKNGCCHYNVKSGERPPLCFSQVTRDMAWDKKNKEKNNKETLNLNQKAHSIGL